MRKIELANRFGLVLCLFASHLILISPSSANNVTVDFSYTGSAQTWIVPSGVTAISFTVTGASGGKSNGGLGASISGTLSVTPSSTLQINVGQIGQTSSSGATATAFNGGGLGSRYASGGGGASDIRNGAFALSNRLVVAGGGGGGDGSSTPPVGSSSGGNAGYSNGANGVIASGGIYAGNPGNGATQSGGGSGGTGSSSCGAQSGVGGTLGTGGNGATASAGGGGGGGGYYGGGGAGSGCNPSGGGGGSSYINATFVSGVSSALQTSRASGTVQIVYFGPDITAPAFTTSSSVSAAENIAISANAATIKVSESATITISSGADASLFNLVTSDSVTAYIRFKAPPDFEAPSDVGANNVYEVTLNAVDAASNAGTQSITITVTDVVDTSSFNSLALAGSATTATFRTSVVVTASVTVASRVTFRVNGRVLPGCIKKLAAGSGSSFSATCNWRPSNRGVVVLTATATPTGAGISSASATPVRVAVGNRSGRR